MEKQSNNSVNKTSTENNSSTLPLDIYEKADSKHPADLHSYFRYNEKKLPKIVKRYVYGRVYEALTIANLVYLIISNCKNLKDSSSFDLKKSFIIFMDKFYKEKNISFNYEQYINYINSFLYYEHNKINNIYLNTTASNILLELDGLVFLKTNENIIEKIFFSNNSYNTTNYFSSINKEYFVSEENFLLVEVGVNPRKQLNEADLYESQLFRYISYGCFLKQQMRNPNIKPNVIILFICNSPFDVFQKSVNELINNNEFKHIENILKQQKIIFIPFNYNSNFKDSVKVAFSDSNPVYNQILEDNTAKVIEELEDKEDINYKVKYEEIKKDHELLNIKMDKAAEESKKINDELAKINEESKKINDELAKAAEESKKINDELAKAAEESKKINDELAKINEESKKINDELAKTKEDLKKTNDELAKTNDKLAKELKKTNDQLFDLKKKFEEYILKETRKNDIFRKAKSKYI